MNADKDSETNNMIRSTIKEHVTARNAINTARIAHGNTISADQIFAQGAIVSLLIPKAI